MRHEQSKATVVPDIPVFSLERDFPTSTVKKNVRSSLQTWKTWFSRETKNFYHVCNIMARY